MYSIIIPHYKYNYLLRDCLDSVKESFLETKQDTSFEIYVVNNNATQESKHFIEQYRRNNSNLAIKPIYNRKNLGFAKAVNQGIKKSHGNYIVVLNNDIKLGKDWFNAISQARYEKNNKKTAVFFGKVLNEDGTEIESAGLDFKPWGKAINIGNKEKNIDKYNQSKIIWGAPANAVVYKKEAIEEAGFFNPDFFAYLEDVELNLRLRNLGYQTQYIQKAISYHLGGQTADRWTDFRQRYTCRNWIKIFKLHYSRKQILKYFPKMFIEQLKIWLSIKKWKWRFWVIKEI